MKKGAIIIMACLAVMTARASDQVWSVTTHASTSTVTVTSTAKAFTGELLELQVYNPAGATGVVTFAAVDPYNGESVTLASGSVATSTVWRPRIAPVAVTGEHSVTVTNSAGASEFFTVAGEAITAALSGASVTNQEWKFRVKYERQ
jgi:hypothetical protein